MKSGRSPKTWLPKKYFSLAAGSLAIFLFLEGVGCGKNNAGEKSLPTAGQTSVTKPNGPAIFRQNCVVCHGNDGKLGLNGAKDLSQSTLSLQERILVITHGRNAMAPWEGLLSAAEIEAVADFTRQFK